MKGYIIYATNEIIDNRTVIQLFGRLENGQSFCTINKFKPYFYAKKKDAKQLNQPPEQTKLKNFKGEEVVKFSFDNSTDLNNTFKEHRKEIEIYEADLKPHYKFLMDKDILGAIEIEGEYEPSEKIDRVYKEPKISALTEEFKPNVKVVSLDIETSKDGKLYCIGLSSENYKKDFMITSNELRHAVSCKDEEECLKKFKQELLKLDPDIITGWNVIDFDFAYLRDAFKRNKILFDIGRTNDQPKLRIESGFFRSSSIDIPGRQVLDGLNLIKDPFIKEAPTIKFADFASLTLEDVSQALIGKGKLLKGKGRPEEIEQLYKENTVKSQQKLVEYNLLDCELVYEMLEKTKIIDLAIERSQLTGLTLDRLSGSIVAFDSLYIREAKKHGLISPSNIYKQKEERITGGYVYSAKPGLYKNVLVLDFKSLYASIIRTFNIDPASFLEKEEKGCIKAPNGACFKNQDGILPIVLEKLHNAREKAKKENRELSNHAIKVIILSFWGVIASPNLRYFNLDMANAITNFAQFITKLTAKEIEKMGYRTIYSDTDSVFVETKLPKTKANALGNEIAERINNFYKDYIKKDYNRKSFLELEFEKQYLAMIIPKVRGKGETAAKKRYAGLKEVNGKEEIEVVGLEAIRGDWTEAAQEFQIQLLDKLFHDQPIQKFIRDYLKKIRSGKLNEKLIYRKSIRKDLSEYTKTTPSHVKAARKLPKLESNVIEYYITIDGPEPIQKHKSKIDYEHYVEKQIKPIAEQILVLFNEKFEDVAQNSKQTKLF
ncbi:MAG: DNA polymerase II [archaeon]